MKRLVPLAVVLGVLLVPYLCYSESRTAPFRVRVVDERTGRGVSNARVTVENGAESTTEYDGSVLFWLESSMMNRTVRFTIERRGITTTVELPVQAGGIGRRARASAMRLFWFANRIITYCLEGACEHPTHLDSPRDRLSGSADGRAARRVKA